MVSTAHLLVDGSTLWRSPGWRPAAVAREASTPTPPTPLSPSASTSPAADCPMSCAPASRPRPSVRWSAPVRRDRDRSGATGSPRGERRWNDSTSWLHHQHRHAPAPALAAALAKTVCARSTRRRSANRRGDAPPATTDPKTGRTPAEAGVLSGVLGEAVRLRSCVPLPGGSGPGRASRRRRGAGRAARAAAAGRRRCSTPWPRGHPSHRRC